MLLPLIASLSLAACGGSKTVTATLSEYNNITQITCNENNNTITGTHKFTTKGITESLSVRVKYVRAGLTLSETYTKNLDELLINNSISTNRYEADADYFFSFKKDSGHSCASIDLKKVEFIKA